MRNVLAVIAGYLLWSVLWVAGGAGLAVLFAESYETFTAGEALADVRYLALALVLSVICSFFSGMTTASIAKDAAKGATLVMALLLLATGIAVQLGSWDLMPVWYHLTFLALIVPVCLIGARRVTT